MPEIEYSGRDNLDIMKGARNYNAFLLDLVAAPAQKTDAIVDFGAGGGTFCLPLTAMGYRNLCCIETDPVLSRNLAERGMEVRDSLEGIPDNSLDYIYTLNVLEHIAEDSAIAALWHRKLRTGGKLLVYVPAFQLLFSSMDSKVGHYRRYRKHGLSRLLQAAGFRITEGRYVDSVGFFATLAYRLFGSRDGSINPLTLHLYDRYAFPVSRLLDRLAGSFFGKNVYVLATKPPERSPA